MADTADTLTPIEAIRARWRAATPGPWFDTDQPDGVLRVSFYPLDGEDGGIPYWVAAPHDDAYAHSVAFPGDTELYAGADLANARFIAASWANVRDLLAEVDRLRGALAPLVADAWAGWHWDEDRCAHSCVLCRESGPGGGDAPRHGETCPYVAARAALAGEGAP